MIDRVLLSTHGLVSNGVAFSLTKDFVTLNLLVVLVFLFLCIMKERRLGMSREIANRIEYTVTCISEFSYRHSLSYQHAYLYLKKHGGIEDAIDDLTLLCKRNGGNVA